jgi:hypothetical protein
LNIQNFLAPPAAQLQQQQEWWVKIQTDLPCCIYYFGPFDNAVEAQTNRSGYIEDLEHELAQGIHTTIELCHPPKLLTIDCL